MCSDEGRIRVMRTETKRKKNKIALFGGTFDPFHRGHLELLENLSEELHPDRMIIIPAGHPYMKETEGRSITPADDRIGMVRAGLSETDLSWEISRVEVDKEGPSYSVETVAEIRASLPEPDACEIFFLCGSDVLFGIDKWYRYRQLLAETVLTVVPRGGDDLRKIRARKRELEEREGARIIITKFRGREISSSAIRDDILNNADMLPEGTRRYIREHHLYGC